ncbi:uncharacterized protein LOC110837046 [Zootermopsis nevadensis]|uniref:uncharacterized protein LOC110837046 n=1 Tax=Zootermopsis nevadensis TaxID=136037 RepID=UPI000B8EA0CD|nr:uncharacterized protein LOC110837046 [Zootermopsis nevadensis]
MDRDLSEHLLFHNIITSNLWPLLVAIAVAGDTEMVCPGLEMTVLHPQCINDRNICPQNSTWEPRSKVCDMCDGCTTYLQQGDECEPNGIMSCKPGYECDVQQLICVAKSCSCQYKFDINYYNSWRPRCDGYDYGPVQCKGEKPTGRCFCFDKKGKRIFGEQLWSKAENMTCACSRRVLELQEQGRIDVTLHCNEQGNYDELQCDDGMCWCAEERTGTPISRILPENMMTMLPCYDKELTGSGYLRQCESLLFAQKKIEIEMAAHNSINPNFPHTNCELDGSYGAVQQDGNQFYCGWKDKSRINGYAAEVKDAAAMNCRCARDNKMYGSANQCLGNGNYNPEQYTNNGTRYCIDADGFLDDKACPDSPVQC